MYNTLETYEIKNGDTLYDISKKNNINPELLALINGLNTTDYIYENQTIFIPKKDFSYYLTKKGDTLKDVLSLFNTDYVSISKYNDIIIEDGQLIGNKR